MDERAAEGMMGRYQSPPYGIVILAVWLFLTKAPLGCVT